MYIVVYVYVSTILSCYSIWHNHHPLILLFGLEWVVPVLLQVLVQPMRLSLNLLASQVRAGAAHRRSDGKSGVDCPNAILVWLLRIQELWMDIMPPTLIDFPPLRNTDISRGDTSDVHQCGEKEPDCWWWKTGRMPQMEIQLYSQGALITKSPPMLRNFVLCGKMSWFLDVQ